MLSYELREKIRELMVDFGLNQTQLSKKTGIGVSTISSLLREPKAGTRAPNVKLSTLETIAKELGCCVRVDFVEEEWIITQKAPEW